MSLQIDTTRGRTYVRDARINVAKFLEAKEPRTVGRVIEGEGLKLGISIALNSLKSLRSRTVVAYIGTARAWV